MEKSFREMIDDIEKEYFEYIQSASTYFVGIRNLATDKGEIEVAKEMQYEVDVFLLHEKHPFIDRHHNYVRRFDDKIDSYPEEQIEYYLRRIAESNSVQLKCRYADVLIDYKGKHLKIKKIELLKILIPLLIENAMLHLSQKEQSFAYFEFFRNIARAVEVTISFNNKEFLKSIIDTLDKHMGIISEDDENYRWVLESAEIIRGIATSRLKDLLPADLIKYSVDTLEKVKGWYWTNNDHNFHRIYCEEIIKWAKLLKYSAEQIHSLQLEIGESFEQEAIFQQGRSETSNLVKAHFLEQALRHYADIGETEKIEIIKKQIYDAYVGAQPEFKAASASLKLDKKQQEKIERIINAYRQMSLEAILILITHDKNLVPDIDKIIKLTEEQASNFPLQSLIGKSIVSDGKKTHQPTTDEENFEMSLNSNYMINVQLILELALLPVFDMVMTEKGLNAEVIIEKLRSWELMKENNISIMSAGLKSFFNNDYISSLHVLVPQFEACVRNMFIQAGVATTTIKKGMAQHEETFNEFLKREDVIQSLGKDVHKFIQFVMVEQSGMNLRNNIAHGLIKAEACNKSLNVLVIQLFLLLTIYELKESK